MLFWYDPDVVEGLDEQGRAVYFAAAWDHTRDLVERVWATEVVSIDAAIGEFEGNTPAASALETTLRDSAGIDVTADLVGVNEDTTVILQIEVNVPDAYDTNHDFEINLECFAPVGTSGAIYSYNNHEDAWDKLKLLDSDDGSEDEFECATPTIGESDYAPVRRTWIVPNGPITSLTTPSSSTSSFRFLTSSTMPPLTLFRSCRCDGTSWEGEGLHSHCTWHAAM